MCIQENRTGGGRIGETGICNMCAIREELYREDI